MTTTTTHDPIQNPTGPRKSDRLIPWYFVGGFAVMLIANICLIVFSQTSWVGLVSDHAFEDGNNYNTAIADAKAQSELGWRTKISVAGVIDNEATIIVLFRDKTQSPISGAKMEAVLMRNDRDDVDEKIMLSEVSPGEYRTRASVPVYGNWKLRIVAHAQNHDYQVVEDVLITQ
ncbi:integral membrane protein linked to a cation pump [Thalassospira profundimaris]|uniref:Integral membrane protein linked to a cation pump n=1 Tax=Thalassospira profundimaris TaxID=502049 RepID=A0A367WI17_9PROT|nr:FixH family protein [Thalassospira profundimaris]RCK41064.1 integral membrane protein linked to a cation pump [Thalassospira profundimaris]